MCFKGQAPLLKNISQTLAKHNTRSVQNCSEGKLHLAEVGEPRAHTAPPRA